MDIVYRKTDFNREFSRFLMYKKNNHLICFEKHNKYVFRLKIPYTQHEFLAKSDAKIYIMFIYSSYIFLIKL